MGVNTWAFDVTISADRYLVGTDDNYITFHELSIAKNQRVSMWVSIPPWAFDVTISADRYLVGTDDNYITFHELSIAKNQRGSMWVLIPEPSTSRFLQGY